MALRQSLMKPGLGVAFRHGRDRTLNIVHRMRRNEKASADLSSRPASKSFPTTSLLARCSPLSSRDTGSLAFPSHSKWQFQKEQLAYVVSSSKGLRESSGGDVLLRHPVSYHSHPDQTRPKTQALVLCLLCSITAVCCLIAYFSQLARQSCRVLPTVEVTAEICHRAVSRSYKNPNYIQLDKGFVFIQQENSVCLNLIDGLCRAGFFGPIFIFSPSCTLACLATRTRLHPLVTFRGITQMSASVE